MTSRKMIAAVVDTARRRRGVASLGLGATPSDAPDTVADLEAVVVALADELAMLRAPKSGVPSELKAIATTEIIGSYWNTESRFGGSWRFSRQELSGPPGVDVVPLVDARKLNEARQQLTTSKAELNAARRANELLRQEAVAESKRSVHDIRMGKLHDLPENITSIRIDRDTTPW